MHKLTCILHLIVSYTAHLKAGQMEGKIVGGNLAEINKHPHSVLIKIKRRAKKNADGWKCGASIVNQKILLTAAHCIDDCDRKSKAQAYVGNEQTGKGRQYLIDSFFAHEYYNEMTLINDIAMLKTEKPIKFSRSVKRVALMKNPPYSESAVVAGWGLLDEVTERFSQKLKYLSQKVWKRSDCLKTIAEAKRGTICAAATSDREFAAQGDSGSALMVRGFIQIGLVSYKKPDMASYLIVYTDVGYFYDWINYNTKYLYCSSYTAHLKAGQMEGKIVGGNLAEISKHPHSVFIIIESKIYGDTMVWKCGASIINQKILLTAGHCIIECVRRCKIRARVGNEKRNQGREYIIDSFFSHEHYVKKKCINDIAMLRTKKPIKFSRSVKRVALMKNPPYSESAVVAGWGLLDEENEVDSFKLKYLSQKVWKRSDCLETIDEAKRGTICAAATSDREFAAQGDSGSALMVNGYIQIGLVSYKLPYIANYLVVYTDVGYFYDWIKDNTEYLYCL